MRFYQIFSFGLITALLLTHMQVPLNWWCLTLLRVRIVNNGKTKLLKLTQKLKKVKNQPCAVFLFTIICQPICVSSNPLYAPTFVLVRQGQELGCILGYAGEDLFWGFLETVMAKLPKNVSL